MLEMGGTSSEMDCQCLKYGLVLIRPEMSGLILAGGGSRFPAPFFQQIAAKGEKVLIHLGVRVRCGLSFPGLNAIGVGLRQSDGTAFDFPERTVLGADDVSIRQRCPEHQRATGGPVGGEGTHPGSSRIYTFWPFGNLRLRRHRSLGSGARGVPGVAQVARQQLARGRNNRRHRQDEQVADAPFQHSDSGVAKWL